jgi:hypothetical protein
MSGQTRSPPPAPLGPYTPRTPRAFTEPPGRVEFCARHLLWAFVFGAFLFFVGWTRGIDKVFVARGLATANSFRFFVCSFALLVVLATFLLLTTSKEGDRGENMRAEHPVAAYSMTFSVLVMVFASFLFWVDLLGLLGILFFVAFWGFFFNLVLIIPL